MRLTLILRMGIGAWMAGALSTTVRGGPRNEEAIASVLSGKVTEARASWWGFGPVESTQALQGAIDSGARKVIVENMGKPWIVDRISVASNQEIVFEKGCLVVAKRGAFRGGNDLLITISEKQNVTLSGYGAELRMWRSDYDSEDYKKAEWRNVVNVRSSRDIRIYGLTLTESGGDGIYLGVSGSREPNTNIHIKDVTCDRNYRQGISVISAKDLLIEDTVLSNTAGTPPAAGIDFEPNHAAEELTNCVMRNCTAYNNAGVGYAFYLPNLTAESKPISIRLENCVAKGSNARGFSFTAGNTGPGAAVAGSCEVIDCTFRDSRGQGITVSRKAAAGCRMTFTNCRVVDTASETTDVPQIGIAASSRCRSPLGGIDFRNCIVEDSLPRPVLGYGDWTGGTPLVDVTGDITLVRDEIQTTYRLTEQLLEEWFPVPQSMARIEPYDSSGVSFVPVTPRPDPSVNMTRPFRLRSAAEYVTYARAGEEVVVSIEHVQLARYSGRPIPVSVSTPTGERIALGTAPFKETTEFRFRATATGIHTLSCSPGQNMVQVQTCSHPLATSGLRREIHFLQAYGDFYFWVPAGTEKFGVKVYGDNSSERVAATVFDPSGATVWEETNISRPALYVGAGEAEGKLWRLRLGPPSEAVCEDFYVDLLGIPPLLAASPASVMKPVRDPE